MADEEQNIDTTEEFDSIQNTGDNDVNSGKMDETTDNANIAAGDDLSDEGSTTTEEVNSGTSADLLSEEGAATEDEDNAEAEVDMTGAINSANSSDSSEQDSVPDQGFNFFLIHLSDSKYRYDTVIPKLNEQGINYQIVGINGTQVQFWHNVTNTYFSGAELIADDTTIFSRGNHQLNKFQKYNITCDPDSSNPTKFPYNGFDINAGQMGQLCSHVKCWQEAEKEGYKHTVIMADNALPAAGLKDNLSYIASNAPEDYDFIFLAVNQTDGGRISYNSFLDTFTPDARFNNVLGVMISQQGINNLLTDYDVPFNTDVGVYYYEASTCYKGNWNIFCNFAPKFDSVNAYISTAPLLSLYDSESVMGTMGPVKDILGLMKVADV